MIAEIFRDCFCVGGLKIRMLGIMIITMMIYDDNDDENGGLLNLPMKRKQFGDRDDDDFLTLHTV